MSSSNRATNLLPSLLCLETLQHRALDGPGDLQWLRGFYEAQLANDRGECNGLMRAAALAGLVEIQRHEALLRVRQYLTQLHAQLPDLTTESDPSHLRHLCELMDTTVDLMLDVWEPERTSFMQQLLPVQALLRQLATRDREPS